MIRKVQIRINGLVQGVGFRPHVWKTAHHHNIFGAVLNDARGVLIYAVGEATNISQFIDDIATKAPPLSRIDKIETTEIHRANWSFDRFEIVASKEGQAHTHIVPDAATCPECLTETTDPTDRRYRYPFTNCTHCGPRLSIVKAIPYDRANTTMAKFKMCSTCQSEYDDPTDRRFHAQPNACPDCGPQAWLENQNGVKLELNEGEDAISKTAALIKEGHIIAIKGIGGFHLACDARNQTAMDELRRRKRRPTKPFALMAKDIAMIQEYADITEDEISTFNQPSTPIILVTAKENSLPATLAPKQNKLGFMLPYTPLHHLLLDDLDGPLVMTSGNRSHDPQVIDNQTARDTLSTIADYFLMHNRDIENRVDDSVIRIENGHRQTLRRARGYAPTPMPLPPGFPADVQALAMGAELKNTFCLVKDGQAVVSQHMGDQEGRLAHEDYRRTIDLYSQLHDFKPDLIAHDMHPDFLPTRWGHELAHLHDATLVPVQHHHAHVAAVMGEHILKMDHAPVLGVVMDGLGLSPDGEIWGGEFLLADYRSFERLDHLAPTPLIGGEKAMKEPWRNFYAQLHTHKPHFQMEDISSLDALKKKPLKLCDQLLEKQLNTPNATSAGRLFDAVAAALGICFDAISYEGEAAIQLEQLASRAKTDTHLYNIASLADLSGLWEGILTDLNTNITKEQIAYRFHASFARAIANTVHRLHEKHEFQLVTLSGGVFQNAVLLKLVTDTLAEADLTLLTPKALPANDGAISFGQALIGLARLNENRG